DAAPFLNRQIGWEVPVIPSGLSDGEAAALSLRFNSYPLALPAELTRHLGKQNDWMAAKVDWARWKLDFSWFAALSQFDVWSDDSDGPVFDARLKYRVTELPTPRYFELFSWAKLRL